MQGNLILVSSNNMLRQVCTKRCVEPVKSVANTCYSSVATIDVADFNTLSRVQPWDKIPGPISLPLIGQLLCYTPRIGNLDIPYELDRQTYLQENYGPVVRLEGLRKEKSVYLFDLEDFRKLYHNEMSLPNRNSIRPLTYFRKIYNKTEEERNEPSTLLTENNENWRMIRTAANPVYLKPDVVNSFEEPMNEIADDMIKRLRKVRNENEVLEKSLAEFAVWAIETVSTTHFGGRIYCMDSAEGTPQRRLIQVTDEAFRLCESLDYDPKYGLWKIMTTPSFKRAMSLFEEHKKLAGFFIEESIKKYSQKNKDKDVAEPIHEKMNKGNKNFAINLATDALTAGIYTTATTMQLILFNLSRNPLVQDKLRESLKKNDQTYLKACIKETFRLNPPISRIKRTVTKDHVIGGYVIPKGTDITVAHHHASMQEYNFPKPTEYIPERWLVGKDHPLYYGNAHPYAYMPFGFGVRHCIGKRLSSLNIELLTGKIIENFKVSWTNDNLPKYVTKINNVMIDPDYLKLEEIKE